MGFLSAYFLNQFVKQQHIDTHNVHVLVFYNRSTYPSSFDTESVLLHNDDSHHVYTLPLLHGQITTSDR